MSENENAVEVTIESVRAKYRSDHRRYGEVLMTPEMARSILLTINIGNRPKKNRAIENYAGAILRGEWCVTGESIKFSKEGILIDGQNRLTAIVLSGASVLLPYVLGVDAYTFAMMDGGVPRSHSDTLHNSGEKNASAMAAGLGTLVKLHQSFASSVLTGSQELVLLNHFPNMRNSVLAGKHKDIRKKVAPALASAVHCMLTDVNTVKRDEFFRGIETGTGLDNEKGVRFFREAMIANAAVKPRMSSRDQANYMIQAFNTMMLTGKEKATAIKNMDEGQGPFSKIIGFKYQSIPELLDIKSRKDFQSELSLKAK